MKVCPSGKRWGENGTNWHKPKRAVYQTFTVTGDILKKYNEFNKNFCRTRVQIPPSPPFLSSPTEPVINAPEQNASHPSLHTYPIHPRIRHCAGSISDQFSDRTPMTRCELHRLFSACSGESALIMLYLCPFLSPPEGLPLSFPEGPLFSKSPG